MTWGARGRALVAAGAGAAYLAVVFAVGFVLAPLRALLIAPHIGSLGAHLIVLPVLFVVAWLACSLIVRAFRIRASWFERSTMSVTALALLMTAELVLSGHLSAGKTTVFVFDARAAALVFAGQIVFAFIPIFSGRGPALAWRQ